MNIRFTLHHVPNAHHAPFGYLVSCHISQLLVILLDILAHYHPTNMSSTPSLSSKVILITGANSGIGKATALSLALQNPAQLWVAARNVAGGHAAVADIKATTPTVDVRFVECDLASFDSVAKAAREVVDGCGGRLDVVMLNAGVVCLTFHFPAFCLLFSCNVVD